MNDSVYTLGVWRVKPGKEIAFIEAWQELGAVFSRLPQPPGKGTLLQSVSDPTLFYSFGPWRSLSAIQAMREDPQAQDGVARLRALCTEATPGNYRVVAEA